MSHAIIFGAGRIGRGLLGELFQQAGYDITFVDKNINLVDQLNLQGRYTIHKAYGALTDTLKIRDIRALHAADEGSIVEALCKPGTIAAVAVSPFSLVETANVLAMSIARHAMETPDKPFDILLCDNGTDPMARMYDLLAGMLGGTALTYLEQHVGLVRTIVMRLCAESPPENDEEDHLALLNNGYPDMAADAAAFQGTPPNAPMLRLTNDFAAESARKTYTLNMAQAAMAYLGSALGLTLESQAISHPRVRTYLLQALEESAHGLCGEHGFARRQMDEWNQSIIAMLENPALGESLARLGIDASRKVGPHDRLVGAATLCQKYNRSPFALARIIAYAYLFKSEDPGTRKLHEAVQNDGIELALERFSRLDYRSPLRALVLEEYQKALHTIDS